MTTVSRVFLRPDRDGYYLGVPVPYELLKKLKKSELVRKLGNTYKRSKYQTSPNRSKSTKRVWCGAQ